MFVVQIHVNGSVNEFQSLAENEKKMQIFIHFLISSRKRKFISNEKKKHKLDWFYKVHVNLEVEGNQRTIKTKTNEIKQ